MNTGTIQGIINYVREKEKLAWESRQLMGNVAPKPVNHYGPDTVALLLGVIATRLEKLAADEPVSPDAPEMKRGEVLANPPLRVPVVSMPGRAALAYRGGDSGLPRLNAAIETCKNAMDGKEYQECVIYIGNEVLADMAIFRGKAVAVKMVRGALKGAMSRLGKHCRMTANKTLRRGEQSCKSC